MNIVIHILLFTVFRNGWSITTNRFNEVINLRHAEELAKNGHHFFIAMTRAACYNCGQLLSKFKDFHIAFEKANTSLKIHSVSLLHVLI
ncbi:hypothetical protein ANCCAN_03836 [Ancylostoma caninum]|uniref:Yippee domain-containing protein n=1 Tax=Ancylostoma caninum TaxID=29170 RepID=A0A368H430_ANCCA|nr:hypothetical protein ANCCAN_03836 [Ancylostoma caninum]